MLSSVLRSPMAVKVNVEIMRAFVRLRRLLATPGELVAQLADPDQPDDGPAHAESSEPRSGGVRQLSYGGGARRRAAVTMSSTSVPATATA